MGDEETTNNNKKRKNTSKYNYSFGDNYPKVKDIRDCLEYKPVPAKMGWNWKAPPSTSLKPRRGWTPGAVGKSVAKLMTFKVARLGKETKDKKKKKKKKGAKAEEGGYDSDNEDVLVPKPTLRVQRKGDVFTIEVNPLKDLTTLAPNEDPYVDCDPLVFKIIKKRSPEEQAKAEARKMMRVMKQRNAEIRNALADAVEDICKCTYMEVFCNDVSGIDKAMEKCPAFQEPDCICKSESLSSLSSNATWDIEYTPPFGCFDINASRKTKRYVSVDTQYTCADVICNLQKETPKTSEKSLKGTNKKKKKE